MTSSYSTDPIHYDAWNITSGSQSTSSRVRDQAKLNEATAALIRKRSPEQGGALLPPSQVKLAAWPESKRGAPNVLLRCSLFSATNERFSVERATMSTLKGVEIVLTGVQFNQKDLDYLLELLHMQRLQPFGHPIQFTARSVLKSLSLDFGNYQYTELKNVIARLQTNKIEIRVSEKEIFKGPLIEKIERDEQNKYLVWLNPQLADLFKDGYTLIDSVQRYKLGKHMLAKALHAMYSTHAKPHAFKVATVQKLIGSTTSDLSKFRQQLRNALDVLKEVNAIRDDSRITSEDLVNILRDPTRSQQKHLANRRVKPTLRR